MRTITITSEFDAPADVIWPAVTTPHAFVHVAHGMVRFPAAARVDGPWQVGQTVTGWTLLFNVMPFSRHHLAIASIDDETRTLVSDERGGVIRRWHHTLHVEPTRDGRCRYTDTVEIDAGALTPVVAGCARIFYRYRQRRWTRLARMLAAVDAARESASGAMAPAVRVLEIDQAGDHGRVCHPGGFVHPVGELAQSADCVDVGRAVHGRSFH